MPSSRKELLLVMTKYAGLEGTCALVRDKRRDLAERFSPRFLNRTLKLEEELSNDADREIAGHYECVGLSEAGEKGIFASLWELASDLGLGLEADLRKISLRQESIEITNYLDVNPYEISSGGVLLIAVKRDEAGSLLDELDGASINADIIGSFNEGNDRVLLNRGAVRFLTPVKRIEDEIKLRNSQKSSGKVADQSW